MKTPQRKNHKSMTDSQLEEKIMAKYTKLHPEPKTLKEKVEVAINKLA